MAGKIIDEERQKDANAFSDFLLKAAAVAFPLGLGGSIGIAYAAVKLSWP